MVIIPIRVRYNQPILMAKLSKRSIPMSLMILVTFLISCSTAPIIDYRINQPTPTAAQTWWIPAPGQRLQIQFIDYPVDLTIQADIFDVDLFEIPQQTIDELHQNGKKVICYINAGAWEDFRPDADQFPSSVVGRDYDGWYGEKWLDVSRYYLFSRIIEARFDLAVRKGCDAVETDNVQNHLQPTGFEITAEDQLSYNLWLSSLAHERSMGIGLKNNPEQVFDLLAYYDFAIIEDCAIYAECTDFRAFIDKGKAVFQIEYTDQFDSMKQFCAPSLEMAFGGLFKHRQLDSWVQFCE
ncbi:MAG: endo alpha-1,4 polygalactosaminidase [Chloroflexi bacterium]|nr:endo alpha-1,4 polygalactosaminidase [Chloroflexota bacterium]